MYAISFLGVAYKDHGKHLWAVLEYKNREIYIWGRVGGKLQIRDYPAHLPLRKKAIRKKLLAGYCTIMELTLRKQIEEDLDKFLTWRALAN